MAWLEKYQIRRTFALTAFYVAFIIGIKAASSGYAIPAAWLCLPGMLICIVRRRTFIWLIFVVLLGLGVGIWRGAAFARGLEIYYPLYGQKITLSMRASEDGVYGKNSQMSFDADHVFYDGVQLPGKITVSGFGVSSVYQGDEIQATAKLYPGFGAYQARMSYAQLALVRHHPSLIASIRRNFAAGMQSALPEPLASFAMGLLIGQRATLPADVKQDLLMVGLTHIIAVSGYNLTIMLQAGKGIFGKASKRLATLLQFLLMGAFVLLAGSSASIVRAAIVSTLSIIAGYYGRSFKPFNLIALAAAISVWVNPVYIWSDASWYLSFLAFLGVMVLAPALSERLKPGYKPPLIVAIALESVCAEIMTLPYVLHTFGQMSFIGLPANVLVVTFVPLAMLLGTLAGIAGMFAPPLAGWVAWPARFLLTYMLDVAHVLSRVPHVFVQQIGFTVQEMMVVYAVIALLMVSVGFKARSKNGTITDRKGHQERNVRTFQMVND
ncbi:MAG TPA: ComEC/Rec2 family competence protein [Candidatus Saccharimonadales bacterium]|nr:ComEC/Rec2 family competence protein [Candidatus Saccharimonadales bacterium]